MNVRKKLGKIKYFVFLVAVGAIMYFATNAVPVAESVAVPAQDGSAQLGSFDFEKRLALISGWASYPDFLFTPKDFRSDQAGAPVEFTNQHAETAQTGTHRLLLHLPVGKTYGVTFRSIDYATRVFIDGREIGNAGTVGASAQETTPRTEQLTFYFTAESAETEIVLQYANFVHKDGGRPPELTVGNPQNIMRLTQKTVFTGAIQTGVLFMAFLHHIGIFFLYGRRREVLYFALVCLLFALRTPILVPMFFPNYNWQVAIRMEYLGIFTASMFLALFFERLFPELMNRKVLWSAAALLAIYDVIIAVTPPAFFSRLLIFYQPVCVLTVFYVTVRLGMSLKNARVQNLLAFVGIFLFAVMMVNDALALNNLPNLGSENLMPTGTVIFMLAYMIILGVEAADKERGLQLQKLATENQLALQAGRYEQLAESVEHARMARHDLRHHLSVIHGYLNMDDKSGLEKYLSNYTVSLPKDDEPPVCQNLAVDAVVRHYLSRAKAAGAALNVQLDLSQNTGIPDAELSIVFGNIFENAARAVERQTAGQKYINARCETDAGKIVLVVDNSMNPNEKRREGVGLRSVEAVAERCGGGVLFEQSAGVFQSSVQLNIRGSESIRRLG